MKSLPVFRKTAGTPLRAKWSWSLRKKRPWLGWTSGETVMSSSRAASRRSTARSEERRVGKEWRCGRAPGDGKKKTGERRAECGAEGRVSSVLLQHARV